MASYDGDMTFSMEMARSFANQVPWYQVATPAGRPEAHPVQTADPSGDVDAREMTISMDFFFF